ncbi:MAG: DNA-3-methyladenine glycosylase I, partial [Actinobacteria bacterium]|nr:DNA-3-methyladenine glycosylase I [Actinomycetota bacterium]
PKSISLDVRATSPESVALSKDLKKRGWSFVGPTTMYAFMQSLGLVNDHSAECCVREQVEAARQRFLRPV